MDGNFITLLFNQIIVMFVLMLVGFIFYKIKFISDQGSKDIGKILLYLVIPIVIIRNFMIEFNAQNVDALIHSTLIALVAMVLSVAVSYLFFARRDGVANFSAAFSNAGFIGIPLISATLGESAVLYISMMIVLINVLQWTYGVFIMTGDRSVVRPKKIITNPIVIAVLIGLVVFITQIPVPSIVDDVFELCAGVNTPLAMMVSGVYLAQSDLKAMFAKLSIYKVSLVRLIIIPLVTLAVFMVLPFGSTTIKLAIFIAAACPVGSNVAIFAQQYNQDYHSAVEQVCMTTILCLISLVVMTMLASSVL